MLSLDAIQALFGDPFLGEGLFGLTREVQNWLFSSGLTPAPKGKDALPGYISSIKRTLNSKQATEMLVTRVYNALLENQDTDTFEAYFDLFEENVTDPVLKPGTRDRYFEAKQNQQNPKLRSDAILYADRPRDGLAVPGIRNEGLELLRDLVGQAAGQVLYITLEASWCIGSSTEEPFLRQLATDYYGKPLRIVRLMLDKEKGKDPSVSVRIGAGPRDQKSNQRRIR